MGTPTVSVVVPCYNYGRYLRECVGSVLDQRGVAVDVTIVDDASTDDSAEVAAALATADPRVRLVRQATNQGHLRTANLALAQARAPFLVKLDADDLLTPGSLARSVALLQADTRIGFVYGHPEEFTGDDVPTVTDGEPAGWTVWTGDAWLDAVLRRAHNVIHQPEVMMRREALVGAGGGYDLRLPWAEDFHLWLRIATRWSVGRVNGCVQGLYRVHPASFQRAARDLRLSDLQARVDAVRLYVTETEGVSPQRRRLALASLARDTRRLLAARRDEPDTAAETVAEYERIIGELESAAGVRAVPGPLTLPGPAGRLARRGYEALRWRRWRATGV